MELVGDVKGRNVVIVDDMADTLGTMKKAAELVIEKGAKSVRAMRDDKLKATDWRFRSDLTPSQEWKDYCQALRDLPSATGFPWDMEWPIEPV